jgi:hypothetical protein
MKCANKVAVKRLFFLLMNDCAFRFTFEQLSLSCLRVHVYGSLIMPLGNYVF